ncbi:hypothetical protein ANO11243_037820 [Dothideomycetidae sp. 11243]|nr:hypothetical protein ANO11243_037820 [fungal sp. No.11243]
MVKLLELDDDGNSLQPPPPPPPPPPPHIELRNLSIEDDNYSTQLANASGIFTLTAFYPVGDSDRTRPYIPGSALPNKPSRSCQSATVQDVFDLADSALLSRGIDRLKVPVRQGSRGPLPEMQDDIL